MLHVKSLLHSLTNQKLPRNQPLHAQRPEASTERVKRMQYIDKLFNSCILTSSPLQCPCRWLEGLRALCWSFLEVKSLCASLDGHLHLSPWLIEGGGKERKVDGGLGIGEE